MNMALSGNVLRYLDVTPLQCPYFYVSVRAIPWLASMTSSFTLAYKLVWNNNALIAAFWESSTGCIQDELATQDPPTSLDDIIILVTCIDIRFAKNRC